jgi:hypothetical protein
VYDDFPTLPSKGPNRSRSAIGQDEIMNDWHFSRSFTRGDLKKWPSTDGMTVSIRRHERGGSMWKEPTVVVATPTTPIS